jgi:hypothetical protein
MIRIIAVTMVMGAMLASCVRREADQKILTAVRSGSAVVCRAVHDGCEYRVSRDTNGWSVLAIPIRYGSDGRRNYAPGDFMTYAYDDHEKLLETMPGL